MATGDPYDFVLTTTAHPWSSGTGWMCATCSGMRYSSTVHRCPTVRANIGSATGSWWCGNCQQMVNGFHQCTKPVSIPTVWVSPQPERKPHACPVCKGRGRVSKRLAADSGDDECPACRGACVLWG
jgi:hypothetical protein